MKNTILCLSLSLSQNFAQTTLETLLPPPMTTSGHHELSLLVVRPLHEEEHFNRSEILRIHLKDLMENKLHILSFIVFWGNLDFYDFLLVNLIFS